MLSISSAIDSRNHPRFGRYWFWYCLLAFVYLVFLFPSPDYNAFNKDDSSSFVVLAMNLSQYGRYTLDSIPREGWGRHGTWPPVFPLVLTLPTMFFGLNWWVLKTLMVILGLASLLSLRKLFKSLSSGDGQNQWLPEATVIMISLSPFFFLFSHVTMTEIPFILATSASLLSVHSIKNVKTALIAGISCGFSFWVRGYAILFIPVIAFYLITKREWSLSRRFVYIATCLTPLALSILGWWAGSKAFVKGHPIDGFTAHYGSIATLSSTFDVSPLERIRQCLWWHFPNIAHHFFPFLSYEFMRRHFIAEILGLFCFLWIVFGCIVCMRKGDRLIVPWLAAGLSFLALTGMGNLRYSLTYMPFIYYVHWFATDSLLERFSLGKNFRMLAVSSSLLLVGAGLGLHLWNPDKLRFIEPFWKDYSSAMLWCKKNLSKDSVIICKLPYTAYGASGIKALYSTQDCNSFFAAEDPASRVPIFFVFDKTDEESARILDEFVERHGLVEQRKLRESNIVFSTEKLDIIKFYYRE